MNTSALKPASMGQISFYGTNQIRNIAETRVKWHGWQDSNLRPTGSKPVLEFVINLLNSIACALSLSHNRRAIKNTFFLFISYLNFALGQNLGRIVQRTLFIAIPKRRKVV